MADAWMTNKGKAELAKQDPTAVTLRAVLVDTAPATEAAMQDLHTLADITANEISGTGYARKTLTSVTITEDDAGNQANIDAADLTWSAINAGTIAGMWISRQVGGSDSTTDPLWCFLGCDPTATNGGDMTLQFNSAGLIGLT